MLIWKVLSLFGISLLGWQKLVLFLVWILSMCQSDMEKRKQFSIVCIFHGLYRTVKTWGLAYFVTCLVVWFTAAGLICFKLNRLFFEFFYGEMCFKNFWFLNFLFHSILSQHCELLSESYSVSFTCSECHSGLLTISWEDPLPCVCQGNANFRTWVLMSWEV